MEGFEKIEGPTPGKEVLNRIFRIIKRHHHIYGKRPKFVGCNERAAVLLQNYLLSSGQMNKGEVLFQIYDIPFIVTPEYKRLFGIVNNDHQPSDFFMKE